MGLTTLNAALLVLGIALLIVAVALAFARAKQGDHQETKFLLGTLAFGLFGIFTIVTTIIHIVIPDNPCAAC